MDPKMEKYAPVLLHYRAHYWKVLDMIGRKKNPSVALVHENRGLRKAVSQRLGKEGRI